MEPIIVWENGQLVPLIIKLVCLLHHHHVILVLSPLVQIEYLMTGPLVRIAVDRLEIS